MDTLSEVRQHGEKLGEGCGKIPICTVSDRLGQDYALLAYSSTPPPPTEAGEPQGDSQAEQLMVAILSGSNFLESGTLGFGDLQAKTESLASAWVPPEIQKYLEGRGTDRGLPSPRPRGSQQRTWMHACPFSSAWAFWLLKVSQQVGGDLLGEEC